MSGRYAMRKGRNLIEWARGDNPLSGTYVNLQDAPLQIYMYLHGARRTRASSPTDALAESKPPRRRRT